MNRGGHVAVVRLPAETDELEVRHLREQSLHVGADVHEGLSRPACEERDEFAIVFLEEVRH